MNPLSELIPVSTSSYPKLFIQLIITLLILYLGFSIVNYLAKKKTQESSSFELSIKDLLRFLFKIFIWSGFGFILSNIIYLALLLPMQDHHTDPDWTNLSFGIILIFIGLGMRATKKKYTS